MDEHAGDVGVGADGDGLAGPGARGDGPFAAGPAGGADHRLDRPEQGDQGMDVVRPHVQQRAPAGQVVEVRLRVPALMAGGDHRRGGGDRGADQALVDRGACGLGAGAQHRVGRGADQHARLLGRPQHRLPLLAGDGEGLLGVDVLACRDRLQIDVGVRGGDGQVQHRVHIRSGEQLLDREGAHALAVVGDRLGAGRVEVRDRHQLHVRQRIEGRQVLRHDHAAADDADPHRVPSPPPRPAAAAEGPWSP